MHALCTSFAYTEEEEREGTGGALGLLGVAELRCLGTLHIASVNQALI